MTLGAPGVSISYLPGIVVNIYLLFFFVCLCFVVVIIILLLLLLSGFLSVCVIILLFFSENSFKYSSFQNLKYDNPFFNLLKGYKLPFELKSNSILMIIIHKILGYYLNCHKELFEY